MVDHSSVQLKTYGKVMPEVKTKGGKTKHFPYTKKGKMAAKKAAKKTGGDYITLQ